MFGFVRADDHRGFVDDQLDHEFHDGRDHHDCGSNHQLLNHGRAANHELHDNGCAC